MRDGRTTLSKFLIDALDRQCPPRRASGLSALLIDVAASIKTIAATLTRGALDGNYGSARSANVHGEEQKKLDVLTNDIFLQHCEWDGLLAGMVSEEIEHVYQIPPGYPRGEYLLAFDPLDGSSNIDINGAVGSIFSVLRAPPQDEAHDRDRGQVRDGLERAHRAQRLRHPDEQRHGDHEGREERRLRRQPRHPATAHLGGTERGEAHQPEELHRAQQVSTRPEHLAPRPGAVATGGA